VWLFLVIRRPDGHATRLLPKSVDLLSSLVVLILILVLLHFSHFTDVLLTTNGFQFRAIDMTESVFHLGLINAMADTYPPPIIYASTAADYSAYHLNMHLQADLLSRWFGIESLLVVSYYVPLLYFSLLAMLPYVFVRESGGKALTGIVCAVLVFGADFSFIPSILLDLRPGFAWTSFFHTTIWALFTLNGYLPSLIALFLCIIVLRDYFREHSLAKLALFALLAYGAFGFKSPMGLQIGAAAIGTFLVLALFDHRRKQGIYLAIVSFLALAAMFVDLGLVRSGVGSTVVRVEPLISFHNALSKLGMSGLAIDWYIPMIIVVFVAGLGVRILGLWYLGTHIRQSGAKDGTLVFLGLLFLSGYIVSELFFIGNPTGQNNAGWFYIQSLMASWFLLFMFLISIEKRKRAYFATIVGLVLLAAPSTVQFLSLRASDQYVEFGHDELQVIDFLRETDPKSVVLHPLNMDRPSLASNFAGRPTVLSVWVSFVTENAGLSKRAGHVMRFFDEETRTTDKLGVLDKYGVDYVIGPASELTFMEDLPGARLELQSGDQLVYSVPSVIDP
jgi:hypothetical protein